MIVHKDYTSLDYHERETCPWGIGVKGDIMCIPHQKPAKPQRREIRGKHQDKKHMNFNREGLEHGDENFVDERKPAVSASKKKKGFFDKLFS